MKKTVTLILTAVMMLSCLACLTWFGASAEYKTNIQTCYDEIWLDETGHVSTSEKTANGWFKETYNGTVVDEDGSLSKVRIRGWANPLEGGEVEAYGYQINDSEPVWSADYIAPDEGLSSSFPNAKRFDFTLNVGTFGVGTYDIKFLCKVSVGEYILSDFCFTLEKKAVGLANAVMPSWLYDFTNDKLQSTFANTNGMTASCVEGEYTTFTATDGDPYTWLEKPGVKPIEAQYAVIYARTDCAQSGEFFCTRTDNGIMGTPGTNVQWKWNATGNWETQVVECYAWLNCDENISFEIFRIDPLQGSDVKGHTIDIKYIAFFATKEEAEAFDYDLYIAKVAHDEEVAKAEEESRRQAEEEAKAKEWPDPTYQEMETQSYDNAAGTLTYTPSEDGQSVTISYQVNGETRSFTVPNRQNYLFGGYGATDDLNRSLYTSEEVGSYGTTGERYVGLFYFLWHGEHGDSGIYNLQQIIDENGLEAAGKVSSGLYGAQGVMHWFAEPLYGYYYANDTWVLRKHMELLTNANIDFLYFDVTNGYYYLDNALQVMKICHELNEQGYDAPQVVFYTHTSAEAVVRGLYDNIYSKGLYEDTWFLVDGKPVIVAPNTTNIDNFFTIKREQWPNETTNVNAWPWMDFNWPQRIFKGTDADGNYNGQDAISVSIAQHSGNTVFSSSALYGYTGNRGRSFNAKRSTDTTKAAAWQAAFDDPTLSYQGLNFQAQFDRAIESDATFVLVTGWNEWVAQRQDPNILGADKVVFIDTGSVEYSRDAEMMRGGYFDNYYVQLCYNVQKLKGTAPVVVQDARKAINVTGSFDQWQDIPVTYTDGTGDTIERDAIGFGQTHYTNNTGRNDIVAAKVTSDSKNVYFYVKTAENITKYDNQTAWMQLYIDADSSTSTGWYGYDYLVNYQVKGDFTSTVAKYADGDWVIVGEVEYRVKNNELMVSVPQSMLDITGYREICLQFKWADSMQPYESMENFYENGDVAPLGRLNYIYQNYIPGVSEITYPELESESETEEPTAPATSSDPSTQTDSESAADSTDNASDTQNTASKKGCTSVVTSGAVLLLLAVLSGAVVVRKRKITHS